MSVFEHAWQKALKNRDKLDACPGHRFSFPPGTAMTLQTKLTCRRCGGDMGLVPINYYCRGYAAAGGDPNEVYPGWSDPR